jgi:hypothetical protein
MLCAVECDFVVSAEHYLQQSLSCTENPEAEVAHLAGSSIRSILVLKAVLRLIALFGKDLNIKKCSAEWTVGRLFKLTLPKCRGSKASVKKLHATARNTRLCL